MSEPTADSCFGEFFGHWLMVYQQRGNLATFRVTALVTAFVLGLLHASFDIGSFDNARLPLLTGPSARPS